MMGFGTKFKAQIDAVLNNTAIRSTATFTPNTRTIGNYGGYEAVTETAGTAVSVNCIPANYIDTKFLKRIYGNFDAGNVRLVIKGNTTVTKEYNVTWQSDEYEIEDIRPIVLNDVIVAKIVTLNKVLS